MKELEENQRGMKRKINPKVMNMIDKWVILFPRMYGVLKEDRS